MSTPSEDQVKIASKIQDRKRQGCITHLKAAGCSDEKVRELLPKYAALDARRTKKYEDLQEALIPAA